jgi:hypothetical protein
MLLKIVSDFQMLAAIACFALLLSAAVFGAGGDTKPTPGIVNDFGIFF